MWKDLEELKEAYSIQLRSAIDSVKEKSGVAVSMSIEHFEDAVIVLDQIRDREAISQADCEQIKSMIQTVIKIIRKNLIDEWRTIPELIETIISKSKEIGLLMKGY